MNDSKLWAPLIERLSRSHMKNFLELAKEQTRLSDFDCWTFTAYCTGKKIRNGKWWTEAEIQAHKEKLERLAEERELESGPEQP